MDVLEAFQDSVDMIWISYVLYLLGAWIMKKGQLSSVIPQVIKLAILMMATDGIKAHFIFAYSVISLSQFR